MLFRFLFVFKKFSVKVYMNNLSKVAKFGEDAVTVAYMKRLAFRSTFLSSYNYF